MCQTTVLIILYDVQRQIHNQKVVIQMRGKDSGRPYNVSDDAQIQESGHPQNPHWHARHISPSPPFILPTKKLHECYPLLHWTFTRQHGSAKESSITASMGAMYCLCQTQEQRPAVLCLNAGKKHFPYSSIFIWSSRNFMNKTDHKIVEGCKEWEMSKAMIRHYDNSDSMVCTPPRVPSSHHCNHQVSLTKHGSTACEVTSVDPSKLKTWNLEFSWIYDHSIHEAVQS